MIGKTMERLLLRLLVLTIAVSLIFLPVTPVPAYHHHDSMVRWREYGSAAFEEAKRTGKPVFMLISAIWCYNCHIYWEKTLETKEVSEYLNENFIPVFLDYDRRKDVARSYPAGGIPVTVIIAPTGESLISVPGYIETDVLLGNLSKTVDYVKKEFSPLEKKAEVARRVRGVTVPSSELLKGYLAGFEKMIMAEYDPVFGGFGQGAKLVHAERLMRVAELYEKKKDKELIETFKNTADHMAGLKQKKDKGKRPSFKYLVSLRERERTALEEVDRLQAEDRIGGVFDPVEGGFFRYATKRDWTAPHFEKMLTENAEMTAMFLKGYRVTGDRKYREIAKKSADYILKVLYNKNDGAFYGSQDADEVYYHFTAEERRKAAPPRVDRTSYAVSSSAAVITMLRASDILKDPRYKDAAVKGLSFLEKNLIANEGALNYYDPEKKRGFINGQLEDNAWTALAFTAAFENTKDKRYLDKAEGIIRFAIEKLYDKENGGFFERRSTSREFYRDDELFLDSKLDSANGVMAYVLLKISQTTGAKEYLKKAEETAGYFMAEFASGELTNIDPYMHRSAQILLENGRYK